ncbi:hypothetical protein POTOM_045432 [Populus tomentosa]|uniref:Uncharacterized protein n=1 Tax=Populus tomentosa TaxID=118781 RepID=A0A8X7YKX4_POPTO|nr:hypothetical protein POTOM_045432 [Populus tomentosa]
MQLNAMSNVRDTSGLCEFWILVSGDSVIVIFAPEDTIQTCAGKLVSADAGVILSSQGVVPYFQIRNSGEPGSFKFPSTIVFATSDSGGARILGLGGRCISSDEKVMNIYEVNSWKLHGRVLQDRSLYIQIQVISLPSSLSLLGSVSKWKVLPAYSDSPSIDTLEFAKALSSEVKNESLLNHLMSAEIIRYPILLTTILTLICKSIHLFMLKDNQIPSLLVNVKEGEKSLTGKGKMDDLKYSICRGHLSDELFAYERECN